MFLLRSLHFLLFVFCIWLALVTRSHAAWFTPLVQEYGGDVAWSAGFLFLVRAIFIRRNVYKLAVICYLLGVIDELSQLLEYRWIAAIRETYIGRLMLGVGFVWSDLVCYAIGVMLALLVIIVTERYLYRYLKITSSINK
jgi:hypothetical protein